MNQGPRRISLTKKNGGKKSRETIPLIHIQTYMYILHLFIKTRPVFEYKLLFSGSDLKQIFVMVKKHSSF